MNNHSGANSIFEELHQNPIFLPREYLEESLKKVLLITLAIAALNVLIFYLWQRLEKRHQGKSSSSSSFSSAKHASCQITHFGVNIVLVTLGLFLYTTKVAQPEEFSNRVTGWEIDFAWLSLMQLAYNLWALHAGIYCLQETSTMLLHHVAVIFVSSMCAFLTNGFRYYTPHFFGVMECSTLPLCIMNFLKSNRIAAISSHTYPITKTVATLSFAVTFFIVRIYLSMPIIYSFLYDVFQMGTSCHSHGGEASSEIITCMITYIAFEAIGMFLACLQLIWGYKIVKGLYKMWAAVDIIQKKTTKDA